MNVVDGGGSSIVFNSAGAAWETRWKSTRMITWRAAAVGVRCASAVTARASSTLMEAPERSMTVTSGCRSAKASRARRTGSTTPEGADQRRRKGKSCVALSRTTRADEQVGLDRGARRGGKERDRRLLAEHPIEDRWTYVSDGLAHGTREPQTFAEHGTYRGLDFVGIPGSVDDRPMDRVFGGERSESLRAPGGGSPPRPTRCGHRLGTASLWRVDDVEIQEQVQVGIQAVGGELARACARPSIGRPLPYPW